MLLIPDKQPGSGEFSLVRVSRKAMATTFEVAIPFGTPNALPAAEAALDVVDAVETQLTVFRDTSEVTAINAKAASGPVQVSDPLFRLLETCAALSTETNGAFDPATGAMTKAWGFYHRQGRVPTVPERSAAMHASGMRHVVLNPVGPTVKFRRPGLELNFGGIGKGYALDRAAEKLRTGFGIRSALLHGGGSSIYAIGYPPEQPDGWRIDLKHPADESRTIGSVRVRDEGLGISAATFQYFVHNGRKLGHVLDPRTGQPAATGTAAAVVLAPSAAAADAWSTALFVLGFAASRTLILPRPHLGAVLLSEGDNATPVALNLTVDRYFPP